MTISLLKSEPPLVLFILLVYLLYPLSYLENSDLYFLPSLYLTAATAAAILLLIAHISSLNTVTLL
jgi:hypothetical protein